MTRTLRTLAVAALASLAFPVAAQIAANTSSAPADSAPAVTATAETPTDDAADNALVQYPNQRPPDFRGLNVFEAPKTASRLVGNTPQLRIGGAFAQQYQALSHSNTPNMVDGVDQNALEDIGGGFNLATANLNVNALLADGVQVNLETYLSSRHHAETWVKGGYLQVDGAPWLGSSLVDDLFEVVTVKVGHFEINYGDAHLRRTDNGNAFYNPFIGNNIMDAFATEIGGEVYARSGGALAMAGITGGEIKGTVTDPDERSYSLYGKLGIDRQVTEDVRLRLMGSAYGTRNAGRNTLYGGDRSGSRFYSVMTPPGTSTSSAFTTGRINPGFTESVTSVMVNPFAKVRGLELFGTYEVTSGYGGGEAESIDRAWTQIAADAVYRFLPREQAYLGARYNRVSGELAGPRVNGAITTAGADVSIDRVEVAAGWFPTRNLLLKVAYVDQQYNDFPATDILSGGGFDGFMVEGTLAF
ncbi:hypothetical protein [Rubrivirga sp. IMCC43871]|uniref:hypothetical protein n=1 Tax=Rubrivirga sp. IMCC43871 TaxID=3391575 RepID=UPI0039903750